MQNPSLPPNQSPPDDELAMDEVDNNNTMPGQGAESAQADQSKVRDNDRASATFDTESSFGEGGTFADAPLDIPDQEPDIEVDSEMVVSYSMQHCNAPPVRAIWLKNNIDHDWINVKAEIKGDPAFFEPVIVRYEVIRSGEKRDLLRDGLAMSHQYLRQIKEAVRGHILIKAFVETDEGLVRVATKASPFEVLTANHWVGIRSFPEMLAAFVVPNDDAIQPIIRSASELLANSRSGHQINGYQEENRQSVFAQMSAIYNAVTRKNIHYQNPPASFHSGQKIRFPGDIFDTGLGTCLDLALLLAGCFEAVGLNPVLFLKEGHAWVGAWLIDTEFTSDTVDDVIAVRKEVDAGKLLCLEATALTHRAPFQQAIEQAKQHITDAEANKFDYAIEVARARKHGYKPMSTHSDTQIAESPTREAEDSYIPLDLEADLPPLDVDTFVVKDPVDPNSPLGRLTRWKSALLDLSLRNTLINYKPDRASVIPLLSSNPSAIEDAIAMGENLKLKPMPSDGGHRTQDKDKVVQAIAEQAFSRKEILTSLTDAELDKRLVKIYRSAKNSKQEGGSNTLYITLGFLRWKESDKSERSFLAPLILVPINLTRIRAQGRFEISIHDDETILNPTLMELLARNFQIQNFIDQNNLPTDEHGVDVPKIWQIFRNQIQDLSGWEVQSAASISELQFKKYLMWKDLEGQTDNILSNNNVKQLIDRENAEKEAVDFPDRSSLDQEYDPAETFCPLDADSSQLAAVYAATEGKSFVIEGPPGTGKSQTIVNILANCAGAGKRVLFVSEKLTALNVVEKRLKAVGLGPFCIEMHSNKEGKSTFAKNIKEVIDEARTGTVEEWQQKTRELSELRDELNSYAGELHEIYPNGLTAHQALGYCLRYEESKPVGFRWQGPAAHTRDELADMRRLVNDVAQVAAQVGEISGSVLERVTQKDWSPGWQDNFVRELKNLVSLTEAFSEGAGSLSQLSELLQLRAESVSGLSFADLESLASLAKTILEAPRKPPGLRKGTAISGDAKRLLSDLNEVQHEFAAGVANLEQRFDIEKLRAFDADLSELWTKATKSWWLVAFFARRKIKRVVKPFLVDGKNLKKADLQSVVSVFLKLPATVKKMKKLESKAEQLEFIDDSNVPLNELDSHVANNLAWAAQLRSSIQNLNIGDAEQDSLQLRVSQLSQKDEDELDSSGRIGRKLNEFVAKWAEITLVLGEIRGSGGPNYLSEDSVLAYIGAIANAREIIANEQKLKAWCDWNRYASEARALQLEAIVEALSSGEACSESVNSVFESSYCDWFAKQVFNERPLLSKFSSAVHNNRIEAFKELDKEITELTKRYLQHKLSHKVASVNVPESETAIMTREANKKRAHKSIREMIKLTPTALGAAKPIMLMSPMSIAQYLDASSNDLMFDLVVFDEASQIPVWDAIGAVGRAKQVVVVGDPKQLPPTNFFAGSSKGDIEEVEIEDQESILDECLAAGLPLHRLNWHYRSRNESLIAFSNQRYYDSTLVTFPAPSTNDKAVSLIHVKGGVYARGRARNNLIEAKAVVDHISDHFLNQETQKFSLGVIAFSQAQQNAIEDILDARRRDDPMLDQMCEAYGDESIFVKNLENSQGDERDVIFFSVGYGKDDSGKMTYGMGALNREGGHRRLNVAVTRARHKVLVFSSVKGEDMSAARCKSQGLKDLKLYLEFADKGQRALAAEAEVTGREFDSPFEAEVADRIKQLGYEVHPQVGVSGYRIDLAIVDPNNPGRYMLAVECDGAMYHSGSTARERDRLRQEVLEGLGWNVYRIWSTDWWMDSRREIDKLKLHIETLID